MFVLPYLREFYSPRETKINSSWSRHSLRGKAPGKLLYENDGHCSSKGYSNYTPMGNQCGWGSILNWPLRMISVWSASGHLSWISLYTVLSNTWMSKYSNFPSQTPWVRPNSANYAPKRDDEYPCNIFMGVLRREGGEGERSCQTINQKLDINRTWYQRRQAKEGILPDS